MVPETFHDFFVASAGVAGALIGLLFVAVSVTLDRMAESGDTVVHRLRASAALTSFTNALVVSLLALVPFDALGGTAVAAGFAGLAFVVGGLLASMRVRRPRWSDLRDLAFLVGLVAVFVTEIVTGSHIVVGRASDGAVHTLSILVVVSFLVGISRAWELIGGPSIGLSHEMGKQAEQGLRRIRRRDATHDKP